MDPSAASVTSRLQNLPFTQFLVSEGETLLELRDGLFPNFVTPPPAMLSTATPMRPWYPCCAQYQHTQFEYRRLKTQPSGGGKDTVSPLSRTICQSVHCLEQLYPKHHEIHLERRLAPLIGSPVLKACCTSPNCNLWTWLHTVCRTVIKPSLISVGECDSSSKRSGSVRPFKNESCLGPMAWCGVASRYVPNEHPSHHLASALGLGTFNLKTTLWRLDS